MISLSEARELSEKFQVIPIMETIFSGSETPVSIFEKLASSKPGSFLLESAEQGIWSRYSFVGVSSLGVIGAEGDKVTFTASQEALSLPSVITEGEAGNGLEAISKIQKSLKAAPIPNLPPLVSGMVGLMGWDTIHQIEKLENRKPKDYPVPDFAMSLILDLVVVDHLDSTLKLISNIYVSETISIDQQYETAKSRIAAMRQELLKMTQPFLAEVDFEAESEFNTRTTKRDFLAAIDKAKKHVRDGDVFQVVLSQRFDSISHAGSLDVYRILRALNPSPYMYLLNFEDNQGAFSVVGSSPEALIRVSGDQAVLHPIAGSRPRGKSAEADALMAEELLGDAKEKAEHLMLVDLARNDLLKVCFPDSVAVTEFMAVERYSHIMHLVSTVEGKLLPSSGAVDAVKASFPAGTLSGAPKPRALEIIEDLEPANRGLFGGVVGYFDFAGNADLAIAIRTALIRDGKAYVQAGAGIVLDSVPEMEYQETRNKASAPLRAIAIANSIRRLK
ncbi:MAG: chorismate-binding protein [Actinomycetota bacterium]